MMKARLHGEKTVASRAAQAPAGGSVAVRQILHGPRFQPKLTVGAPNDAFEREADQVAGQVMRMTEATTVPAVQRMCSECEEEMHAKEEPGETPSVPAGFEQRFSALQGSGRPLPVSERAFFEPRFGRDFSSVRLHSGPAAGELARSVHARAFTLGDSIVLGTGEGGESGRQLLAHELTHVVQQGGAAPGVVRRQTVTPSCQGNEAVLNAAWAEGQRLTERTIDTLNTVRNLIGSGDAETVGASYVRAIRNAFGEVGFAPGVTFLPDLIRRYGQILAAFTSGKDLRCDPQSIPSDKNECDWRVAFVLVGNSKDVFLCPAFFDADRTLTQRGLTMLHELAHSVLRASHEGIAERTVPEALLACELPFGLDYDVAKKNAFAYEMLANCLHGERPTAVVDMPKTGTGTASGTKSSDPRWSISASAGTELRPEAERFAGVLGGRYSLRSGQLVVFNPVIGLNALYLPSGAQPEHLAAATVDLGLRIQQPLRGVYFDVTGGGLAGFTVDAAGATRPTAGLTATAGIGYRWERIELGAEARGLLPLTNGDSGSVLVLGRLAFRLGSSQ